MMKGKSNVEAMENYIVILLRSNSKLSIYATSYVTAAKNKRTQSVGREVLSMRVSICVFLLGAYRYP